MKRDVEETVFLMDDMLNVSELLRRLDVVLEAASSANIIDSHRNDKHSGKCIEIFV